MLMDTYKEYSLAEQVRVKKETIYDFLSLGTLSSEQLPILDYVMREKNLITIASIEYNPQLILQAYFSFFECDGRLYYGQFTKCFPTFYILNPSDFKDKI
jgi:hypothetical protein